MLNNVIPIQHKNSTFANIFQNINKLKAEKINTIEKKLGKLISTQQGKINPNNVHSFAQRVYNFSDIQFSQNELDLLNLGIKYNIPPPNAKQIVINTLLDSQRAIEYVEEPAKSAIASQITQLSHDFLSKHSNNPKDQRNNHKLGTIKKIKERLIENNLVITNIDKSQAIGIIKKDVLHYKVLDFFDKNNVQKLKSDPTAECTKAINNLIDKSKHVLNPKLKNSLKYAIPNNSRHNINAATAPKFKPYVKQHKPGAPIRPLVNAIQSPSYKLAKHLDRIIKSSLNLKNPYTIVNSIQLTKKLSKINVPKNSKLISLDIENLYCNIPVEETLDILEKRLTEAKKLSKEEIKELIQFFPLFLNENYLINNNEV